MKISPRKYALALLNLLGDSKEPKSAVQNFLQILWRRKQFRLLPKILKIFEEELYKREGVVKLLVRYPSKFEESLKDLQSAISKKLGKTAEMKKMPQEDLIGGYQVCYDDILVDASVRTQLEKFQHQTLN